MLKILMGTDWIANRDAALAMIADDIKNQRGGRIWMVPELISHDTERRLCKVAGDTSSRFAEVLSFTRLYRRVCESVGGGVAECLDNGGRLIAMASAARQLHSKLKVYASTESRPEFLTALLDAVDDFKRCCITPADLMRASKQTEGIFAQKLEELSLLYETYDAICQQGKRDPSDQMTWLLEQLEECDFASRHTFYIDGFPDFTRQHFAIVEHLALYAENVVITFNCDDVNTTNPAFDTAAETAGQLVRWAQQKGVPYSIKAVKPRQDDLAIVRDKLFQGDIQDISLPYDTLQVRKYNALYDECLGVAERILTLVRSGARYRDIAIVCADPAAYKSSLSMVLRRCNIPMYLSGTEDILEKTVITTVLAAIDAALNGFERADVLRYLKSMLSPLDINICDKIENYSLIWNITGKRWLKPWENNPGGLKDKFRQEEWEELQQLNEARALAMEPLEKLAEGFKQATSVGQQVQVIYAFLEDIRLAERLEILADQMDEFGDNRNAQILDQLWEILISALEQMYDVLGNTGWDVENFNRLFRLLLSQYDVGTIPPVLDSVMVGPASAMRCMQVKHLFVMGVLEGNFPGYPGSTGVLTDQERVALRQLGVPLMGGAMNGIQAEFAEIYGVFCGAEKTVSVSCPAGQPSFLYKRLSALAGGEAAGEVVLGSVAVDPIDAGAYLVRNGGPLVAEHIGIADAFKTVKEKVEHQLGQISDINVANLYGKKLNLSASQVDRLADCRFSYFMKYGMRAQELKTLTIDPAEFGTYVHDVLEKSARAVMEAGGFHKVSLEDTMELARDFSEQYAKEKFSQIYSERIAYLFRRNSLELELVVRELWDELRQSEFEPVGFEVGFGDDAQVEAIPIPGKTMDAQLRGFIDRVDAWKANGQNYFRIVDYKTGKKDFDYCDVFNGYGLQMLLYLFALQDQGRAVLGENPVPTGVQYFPARVPMVSAEGVVSDEEAEKLREKNWKRKGLLLNDEGILAAMEPGDKPKRMDYTRKKDGTIAGNLADRAQMKLLKGYVFALLGKMVDDIASGCVEANPYTRGNNHNACAFCPYGAVCHPAELTGRRNYNEMSSVEFWNEVGKEMDKNG